MNTLRLLVLIMLLFELSWSNMATDEDIAEFEQMKHIVLEFEKCGGKSPVLRDSTDQETTLKTTSTTTTTTTTTSMSTKMCPKHFDGILCWKETPAGHFALQQCPEWFIGFQNKKEKVKFFCLPDGTWEMKKNSNHTYTDYTSCIEDLDAKLLANHLPNLKLIAKLGSILSMASLILAIIILSSFKRLHCSRNALHINLFASFLLFSVLQLIKETFWVNSLGFPKDLIPEHRSTNRFVMNPNVSHWECKTMMSFYRYAESSNHAAVFSEALYLNALLSVSTFNDNQHFKFYIAIGWVGPLIWIIPFVSFMAICHEANSCWNSETSFSFFYVVPQVLLIFANFALFINVLRILKNKLRKNNIADANSSKRYKKLAKSTLLCGFSFSIYYIAFSVWQPFVRGKLPVVLELIRLYFEIVCGSFQGLAISSIYCFCNSEVQHEIMIQVERKLISRNPNMRRFSEARNMRDRLTSVTFATRNHVHGTTAGTASTSTSTAMAPLLVLSKQNNCCGDEQMAPQSFSVPTTPNGTISRNNSAFMQRNNSTQNVKNFLNLSFLKKSRAPTKETTVVSNLIRSDSNHKQISTLHLITDQNNNSICNKHIESDEMLTNEENAENEETKLMEAPSPLSTTTAASLASETVKKSALRNNYVSDTPKSTAAVSFSFSAPVAELPSLSSSIGSDSNKNIYDKSDPNEFINMLPQKNIEN